jgi:hypothetical protein
MCPARGAVSVTIAVGVARITLVARAGRDDRRQGADEGKDENNDVGRAAAAHGYRELSGR